MKKCSFKLKLLILLVATMALSGCNVKDKKTSLRVVDAERHYYPVLRGQELEILYEIENTGENPLFITDIFTSCGCVVVDESSFKILPVGGKGFIKLNYDTNKNIGYVKHYVTIYANLVSTDKEEVTFDLHVVPNALYTRDYEELHNERKQQYMNEETLVDGRENNRRYYVDSSPF